MATSSSKRRNYAAAVAAVPHRPLQAGEMATIGSSITSTLVPVEPILFDVLLATESPVRLSLFSLNFTAILTTILGSYLALLSTVTDFVNEKNSDEEETGTESQSKLQEGRGNNSLLSRIKVASIISVPASLIACSSPSIFLRAIDFAGSYPVLMLWGVAPPVIALIQRSRDGKGKSKFKRSAGSSAWLAILASLSFGMVGFSAVEDIASFVSRFKGLL